MHPDVKTTINRITPQDIIDAYRKRGIRPERKSYGSNHGCGCPLMAFAVSRGLDIGDGYPWKFAAQCESHLELLGFQRDYIDGFRNGVDGYHVPDKPADEYDVGMCDGRDAWQAVVNDGLVEDAS